MGLTRTRELWDSGPMKLTIREHVKKFATLLIGKRVSYVDDNAVRGAAAALEGVAELMNEADDSVRIPVEMTVRELRHFVSYMRALDNVARVTRETEQRCVVAELQANQMKAERDEIHRELKQLEAKRELEKSEEVAQAIEQVEPKRRASRAELVLRRAAGRARGKTPRSAQGA